MGLEEELRFVLDITEIPDHAGRQGVRAKHVGGGVPALPAIDEPQAAIGAFVDGEHTEQHRVKTSKELRHEANALGPVVRWVDLQIAQTKLLKDPLSLGRALRAIGGIDLHLNDAYRAGFLV